MQPLVFCNWYRHQSCCLPVHDAEISGAFQALVAAGDSCTKFQNRAKYYLAIAACFGCDPNEPHYVSAPLDTAFFRATTSTLKVCASVASGLAPALLNDCGLTLADDRSTVCSPTSAVVPSVVWPDCTDAQFVCQDPATHAWTCADAPCAESHTPLDFANAPCNATAHTCTGALKFLNDNRAAKPVNYEALAVEIVDEPACLHTFNGDAAKCQCLRVPSSNALSLHQQHSSVVGRVAVASVVMAVTAFNSL